MALTRITKGVIKPNENYDTHNIVSTGIVTSVGLDVNGSADISGSLSVGGVLTYEDVTSIDSVGLITARSGIFVSAGSSVGIGTDDLTYPLEIHDSDPRIQLIDTDLASDRSVQLRNNQGSFVPSSSQHTIFYTGGSERVRIKSSGEVGIGSNSPSDKLSIVTDNNNKGLALINEGSFGTAKVYLEGARNGGTGIVGNLQFYNRRNGGVTSNLQVNGDGHFIFNQDVGIGTDEPDRKLHILGTGNAIVKMEANYSGSVTGIEGVLTASGADRYVTGIYGKVVNTSGTESNVANIRLWNEQASPTTSDSPGYITFSTTNDGENSATEKVRITSAGNVGIGTNIPAYGLDVRVESFTKAQFKGKGSGESNIPFYIMSGNSAVQLGIEPTGAQEKIIFQANDDSMRFHTASEERVRINSSGQVGIGTVAPAEVLHVLQSGTTAAEFRLENNEGYLLLRADSNVATYGAQQHLFHNRANDTEYLRIKSDSVLPGSDANLDLGSSSYRWANIYTADLQLSNEGSTNNVDGTWGQYTIQEGESDLFLINRRNGKKYKFMLEEVN